MKLERISQLSKENQEMVFTSMGHLFNKELLKECHEKVDRDKAVEIYKKLGYTDQGQDIIIVVMDGGDFLFYFFLVLSRLVDMVRQ